MSEVKRPHGSRFRDALAIVDPGACNLSGIALSIAEACHEIREHETSATAALCQDPAIRLMVYQLAPICDVAGFWLESSIAPEARCKEHLAELCLRPFGAGGARSPLLTEVGGGRGVETEIPAKFPDDD